MQELPFVMEEFAAIHDTPFEASKRLNEVAANFVRRFSSSESKDDSDVDRLQMNLFSHKTRDVERIPPTCDALNLRVMKSVYQASIWTTAHLSVIPVHNPTDHGWKEENGCYVQSGPFWPLQRMFSIWMLNALAKTNALIANAQNPNSSAPIFVSAIARNSFGLDTKIYQWSTLAVQNFESNIWIDFFFFFFFNKSLSHDLIIWDCS